MPRIAPRASWFACAVERLAHDMNDRFTLPALLLIFVILAAGIVAAGPSITGVNDSDTERRQNTRLPRSRI